jgi:hypothetical protein
MDKKFCNWICQHESCEYHLYLLENKQLSKEEIKRCVNTAEKKDCPYYGNTIGMYVPMRI